MAQKFNFNVDDRYQGYTLDNFLVKNLPQYPEGKVRKIIHDGYAKVNGQRAEVKHRLLLGDKIVVNIAKQQQVEKSLLKLDILHEDERLLVINKPAGIPVVKERWSEENLLHESISGYLREHGIKETPGILHRIDKDASGILLFAKTKDMERYVSKLFETRQIEKKYWAIVAGVPEPNGTIDLPIAPLSDRINKMVISEHGKKSVTHYTLLESFRDFSLVEVKIETGRTHQIRVHMASQGFPLAIDPIYGYREALRLSDLKSNYRSKGEPEKPFMSRLTLHARYVSFLLPENDKAMSIEAPPPKDFNVALKMLRKYRR